MSPQAAPPPSLFLFRSCPLKWTGEKSVTGRRLPVLPHPRAGCSPGRGPARISIQVCPDAARVSDRVAGGAAASRGERREKKSQKPLRPLRWRKSVLPQRPLCTMAEPRCPCRLPLLPRWLPGRGGPAGLRKTRADGAVTPKANYQSLTPITVGFRVEEGCLCGHADRRGRPIGCGGCAVPQGGNGD
jgi:hypothetical protein